MSKNNISSELKEAIWQHEKYTIRFSEPYVQASDNCHKISGFGDIQYFCYTVEILRNTDSEHEQELVAGVTVNGDGHLLEFRDLLKLSIADNPISDGQPYTVLADGAKLYGRSRSVLNSVMDCYEVTKYRNDVTKEDRYAVYIGTTENDVASDSNIGVRFQSLGEKDVKELYNTILGFVQVAVSDYNMSMEKSLAARAHNKLIRDGKLYEYAIEDGNIDFGRLASIYVPGDHVIIRTLQKGETTDNEVTIQDLSMDTVTCANGALYKIYDIVDLFLQVPEEAKTCNAASIMMEFVGILSMKEKEELTEKDLDVSYNKYQDVIADRFLIYDEGHSLPMIVPESDMDPYANGNAVIRMILEMVCMTLAAAKKKGK